MQSDLAALFASSSFADYDGGRFQFAQRAASIGLGIFNVHNATNGTGTEQRSYTQIGSTQPNVQLRVGDLQLNPSAATASCSSVSICPECAAALKQSNVVLYIPGDQLLAALVNVRSLNPDGTCGTVQAAAGGSDFAYTEAIRWAAALVNSGGKSDARLAGSLRLGVVLLDACGSAGRAVSLATGVSRGQLQLTDPASGASIDASTIRAWLSYGDAAALSLAPALRGIGAAPLISASAGSDALTALKVFRSVPANSDQVATILAILQMQRWTCVQLLYSNNEFGLNLATEFRVQALRAGICVPQCVQMPTDANVPAALAALAADAARTRVVVLLTDSSSDIQQLTSSSSSSGLIFISSSYWGERLSTQTVGSAANNSWILQPTAPTVPAVNTHLAGLNPMRSDNPWLAEYYESLFNCSLSGAVLHKANCNASIPITSSSQFVQPLFTMPTLNAVFSVARAVADLLTDLCGANYTEVCSTFKSDARLNSLMANKLDSVVISTLTGSTFQYRSGRDGNMGWMVYQRDGSSYTTVALHMLGSFITNRFPAFAARAPIYSSVPAACSSCTNCPKALDPSERFLYVPGQFLIGGLFDISNAGSAPFSCGSVSSSSSSLLLAEVFKFSIESISSHPLFAGKLRNVTIGGLVLDSCSSSVRVSAVISNFHSGILQLKDPAAAAISPAGVFAYVGAGSSDAALQVMKATDELQLPLISYGATISSLSNKALYPLFSRTVPNDDTLAVAMATLLQQRGVNNAQLIVSPGSYGAAAEVSVRRAMAAAGICVSNSLTLNRTGVRAVNADIVVEQLLKRPQATAVLAFLEQADLPDVLAAVSRNDNTANRFLFLGSTPWGSSKAAVNKITNSKYPTAVTFSFRSAEIAEFDSVYLRAKNPVSYGAVNPWFNEYYQSLFDCSLSSSSSLYTRSCDSITRPLTAAAAYQQHPQAMYVVNAVYAAALGLHSALVDVCGANYTGVCSEFAATTAATRQQRLLRGIRSAEFNDATGTRFRLDGNGDSNRGYSLHQLRVLGSVPTYTAAGSYNATAATAASRLQLSSTFDLSWSSLCDANANCHVLCPHLYANRSSIARSTWPAEAWLIQLVAAHRSGQTAWNCGQMDVGSSSSSSGAAQLLAFHFALDLIRNDSSLASLSLGGLSFDTCGWSSRAAAGSYSLASGSSCSLGLVAGTLPTAAATVAFVSSDSVAATAAAAAVLSNMTLISADHEAAAAAASAARVLTLAASMQHQVSALLSVASRMNWTMLAVLHDASQQGQQCLQAMRSEAAVRGSSLCVRFADSVVTDATSAAAAVRGLNQDPRGPRALLLCLSQPTIRHLLQAIESLRLRGQFALLGTGAWADDQSVVAGLQEAALGAVTIRRRQLQVPAFDSWVQALRPTAAVNALPLDWLQELWQLAHSCRISSSTAQQNQFTRECNISSSSSSSSLSVQQNDMTLATILSTLAAGYGLAAFKASNCGNASLSACLAQMPDSQRREALHSSIASAAWTVPAVLINTSSLNFSFSADGHASFGYDLLNFVRAPAAAASGGSFEYRVAGVWVKELSHSFRITTYGADGAPSATTSVSSRCLRSRTECQCSGDNGTMLQLLRQPDVWQRASEPWGVVALILIGVGFVTGACTLLYLLVAYPKKQQGTHGANFVSLSCLLCVLLLYASCVLFVPHATDIVCGLRRVCLPMSLTLVFACLLVRSIAHWTQYRSEITFSGMSHPGWLLVAAASICLPTAAVCTQWLLLQQPAAQPVAYNDLAWQRCTPSHFYDEGLALACLLPAVLAVAALIFSLLCWDAPMQDAKLTSLALLVCLGSQLAWGCVSTLTEFKWRDPSTLFGNWLSATAVLLCLFVRKLVQLCVLKHQPSPPPEYASKE